MHNFKARISINVMAIIITVIWVMMNIESLQELRAIFRVFKGFLGVWLFNGIKSLFYLPVGTVGI